MPQFYYHGTSQSSLEKIAQNNLQPSEPNTVAGVWPEYKGDLEDTDDEDEFREEHPEAFEARLYVAHTLAIAAEYASWSSLGAVLRIDRDKVSWEDESAGDGMDSAYTSESVPASNLEILTASGWMALTGFLDLQKNGTAPECYLKENKPLPSLRDTFRELRGMSPSP